MTSAKPKLLYITHAYNNRGGVEEHLKTLAGELRDAYDIWITFPEKGKIHLKEPSGTEKIFPAESIQVISPFRAPANENVLANILNMVEPDLIHIVHSVYWPLSLLDQVTQAKKPVVMSFHDYWLATPCFTMEGTSDTRNTLSIEYVVKEFRAEFIRIIRTQKAPEETNPTEEEIRGAASNMLSYLINRRKIYLESLKKVRRFVVPSPYLKDQLERIVEADFQIIPYGIKPFEPQPQVERTGGLRFGYMGSLLPQKGWDTLANAFPAVRQKHPNAELHFFGGQPGGTPPAGMTFHGVYEQSSVPKILSQFDVGIIPSVFAETYSIVLSEMWQGRRIAAVSDIGAMRERVTDMINGRKFPPGNVKAITEVLNWFIENDEWRNWQIPIPETSQKMAERYNQVYQAAVGNAYS